MIIIKKNEHFLAHKEDLYPLINAEDGDYLGREVRHHPHKDISVEEIRDLYLNRKIEGQLSIRCEWVSLCGCGDPRPDGIFAPSALFSYKYKKIMLPEIA